MGLSEAETSTLFAGNAAQAYRLGPQIDASLTVAVAVFLQGCEQPVEYPGEPRDKDHRQDPCQFLFAASAVRYSDEHDRQQPYGKTDDGGDGHEQNFEQIHSDPPDKVSYTLDGKDHAKENIR